jgi:hypothetical protein
VSLVTDAAAPEFGEVSGGVSPAARDNKTRADVVVRTGRAISAAPAVLKERAMTAPAPGMSTGAAFARLLFAVKRCVGRLAAASASRGVPPMIACFGGGLLGGGMTEQRNRLARCPPQAD